MTCITDWLILTVDVKNKESQSMENLEPGGSNLITKRITKYAIIVSNKTLLHGKVTNQTKMCFKTFYIISSMKVYTTSVTKGGW